MNHNSANDQQWVKSQGTFKADSGLAATPWAVFLKFSNRLWSWEKYLKISLFHLNIGNTCYLTAVSAMPTFTMKWDSPVCLWGSTSLINSRKCCDQRLLTKTNVFTSPLDGSKDLLKLQPQIDVLFWKKPLFDKPEWNTGASPELQHGAELRRTSSTLLRITEKSPNTKIPLTK